MKYSYSNNEEDYFGQFDTPEEAAAEAFSDTEESEAIYWVGENRPPCMECPLGYESFIEALRESDDFLIEASQNFDPSAEAMADLDRRVKEMWSAWILANDIAPGFFIVENAKEWRVQFLNDNGDIETDLAKRGVLKIERV